MTARFSAPPFARLAALCFATVLAAPAQAIPKAAEHADAPVTYGADTARPKPAKAQKPPVAKTKSKASDKASNKTNASGKRNASKKPARSAGK